MFEKETMIGIARTTAIGMGLDPALLCALVHHESADWQWAAIRYEPLFFQRYILPLKLKGDVKSDTEATARATSWGLGQVMGQVARELGFKGVFLSELLNPSVGLFYAATKLKRALERKNGDVREALLVYNGGGNPNYPDRVLAHYDAYKET